MKQDQRDCSFQFLRINEGESKPRRRGLTEIRGPYYSVVGPRYLEDLFETMGNYVDSLKLAGGSFTLMPAKVVREIVDSADFAGCYCCRGQKARGQPQLPESSNHLPELA